MGARRRFSAEYTREAVAMLEAPGVTVSQTAGKLGIGAGMLGLAYERGKGVPQDNSQAIKWYCTAVMQRAPEAEYFLDPVYAEGRDVPQDDAQAIEWICKAAQPGSQATSSVLGRPTFAG